MRIHRLDPVVANQIAAGEVVERPASVVKELVENSLDAGARRIRIDVASGVFHLTVKDDGHGIPPDDLPLAPLRHTTSKIRRIEDLEAERTLGFRGEALAAISSVSAVRIASRPESQPTGAVVTVNFGECSGVSPVAMGVGTEVQVSGVFSRHPAREKALKTPAREFGMIQEVVQQLALGRPDVHMQLVHEERVVLETPGRGDPDETVMAIFGRELASHLIPVTYQSERGWQVKGLIAPAHIHRANRLGQGFFINGRWVRNWALRAAVEEAFRPNLPDRRHPYFWFWVDLPLDEVDPNAHPAKAEVRIFREQALKAMIFRLVKEALVSSSGSPGVGEGADLPLPTGSAQTWTFEEGGSSEPSRPVLHQQFRELMPLGQWHAKYILAQGPGGLYLIDQHAAHERIYFERFRSLGGDLRLAQPLLVPVAETLTQAEWAWFEAHHQDLAAWGFDIEPLGGNTVAIRAVPTAFHDLESHQGLFRQVLELMADDALAVHPVSWAEETHYAMAACKAAIKANRPLSYPEMVALLEEMSHTEDPRGCPHGRPTMIVLSLEEVDRRFGRSG